MFAIHQRYKVLGAALVLSVMQVSLAQAQTCQVAIPKTTPASDFTVHNNGTVTHIPTGLMWTVCSVGQTWQSDGSCSGTALTGYNWQTALQIPQTLNSEGGYAGHTDWRLPNIKELNSLVERACHSPAINTAVFNSTPSSKYWSASPAVNDRLVSSVNFENGQAISTNNYRSNFISYHVRLVRIGQ
ncbi:Lcl C-terminal domain-containing protein [Thiomicrospira microaerophila]|uniref:Lcl C-terminal domain-containing protein n=1 Tax=Thiomicrospira microaerophila TaxID=406020 RepID=UPI0005C9B387|nr:DUF1566 domain-containing protein [Thiomicrospira microaerophila]